MTLRLFFLIFGVFFLIGCRKEKEYVSAGYNQIFSHVDKMKKTKNWSMLAYGGSFYGDDVKQLATEFNIFADSKSDYQNALKELIIGAQEFLSSINQDLRLKKYLNHYPFLIEDIKYGLVFYDKYGFLVSHIFLRDGEIMYSLYDNLLGTFTRLKKTTFNEEVNHISFQCEN